MDDDRMGVLSLVKINDAEREFLLRYLQEVKKTSVFEFISVMMPDEFLKFFDVLSGETVKIPRREEIDKIIKYIQIYRYCKSKNFSEEAILSAAKIFDKRVNSVSRINAKMARVYKEEINGRPGCDESGGSTDVEDVI